MSDAVFAVILAMGGLGLVGFAAIMTIMPFVEARERRRLPPSHPGE